MENSERHMEHRSCQQKKQSLITWLTWETKLCNMILDLSRLALATTTSSFTVQPVQIRMGKNVFIPMPNTNL